MAGAAPGRGADERAVLVLFRGRKGGQGAPRDEVGAQGERQGRRGRGSGLADQLGLRRSRPREEAADRRSEEGRRCGQGSNVKGEVEGDEGQEDNEGGEEGTRSDGDTEQGNRDVVVNREERIHKGCLACEAGMRAQP